VISFVFFISIESVGLCSNNDITNSKPLLLITFGSGSDQYSTKTPSSFNFSTNPQQRFESPIEDGWFGFVNIVPNYNDNWHVGALDHTPNDGNNGYMYFVNVAGNNSLIFNFTINDLCIGLAYEFYAYVANVATKQSNLFRPDILFQVRTATVENCLLAQLITGNIPDYDNMTWSKHSLSFIAASRSVVLLIISNSRENWGNDLAIDDIELRVCSTNYSGFCPPG
jgi:hypothetical protein